MHKVFVYGTLKKGEPNHGWLSKEDGGYRKFIAEAETVQKFPLIIGTKYNIPFLLYSPGNGAHVKGEVYEVDNKMLANLDVLEDHPNFYVREEEHVKTLDGKTLTAWIYFIKNFKKELLKKPLLKNYSSTGDHGLEYVARYLRNKGDDHKIDILD